MPQNSSAACSRAPEKRDPEVCKIVKAHREIQQFSRDFKNPQRQAIQFLCLMKLAPELQQYGEMQEPSHAALLLIHWKVSTNISSLAVDRAGCTKSTGRRGNSKAKSC